MQTYKKAEEPKLISRDAFTKETERLSKKKGELLVITLAHDTLTHEREILRKCPNATVLTFTQKSSDERTIGERGVRVRSLTKRWSCVENELNTEIYKRGRHFLIVDNVKYGLFWAKELGICYKKVSAWLDFCGSDSYSTFLEFAGELKPKNSVLFATFGFTRGHALKRSHSWHSGGIDNYVDDVIPEIEGDVKGFGFNGCLRVIYNFGKKKKSDKGSGGAGRMILVGFNSLQAPPVIHDLRIKKKKVAGLGINHLDFDIPEIKQYKDVEGILHDSLEGAQKRNERLRKEFEKNPIPEALSNIKRIEDLNLPGKKRSMTVYLRKLNLWRAEGLVRMAIEKKILDNH
jgi:hypothetical protein